LTAGQHVKTKGIKNLKVISEKIGKPRQTLENWYADKGGNRKLFDFIVDNFPKDEK
jgi:hypothetical protein